MGRSIRADEAFEAWMSNDLSRMLTARTVKTNPIDRHHLLQSIVKETYRRRRDPRMRSLCIETGLLHLSELPAIVAGLRVDMDGDLPRIPLYAWLSTALAEAGRTDEAVHVCEVAAQHDLEDGTKAGYRGRAERIAKRKST
jgi:hypothetical protein